MKNTPESLARRNRKRNYWKKKIPASSIPPTQIRVCKMCGETKPCGWNYTFSQTGRAEYRTRCIDCFKIYSSHIKKRNQAHISDHHKQHHTSRKIKAIEYLGGKCVMCGYKKSSHALTFHHRDKKEKKYDVCSILDRSWVTIKKELNKCDLMCFNCHMELHEKETP